jgi:hypothetical protein
MFCSQLHGSYDCLDKAFLLQWLCIKSSEPYYLLFISVTMKEPSVYFPRESKQPSGNTKKQQTRETGAG